MAALLLNSILLAAILGAPPSGAPDAASTPDQLFTEANRLFNGARSEADLRRASENYEALVGRGIRSGPLYYNLGCISLRLKDWGRAILALRRSLLYQPGDPFAEASLAHARKQVADDFPRTETLTAFQAIFFWHYRTPFSSRLWAFLIAHGAFWLLLVWGSLRRPPFHRTLLGLSLVVSITAGGSLLAETFGHRGLDGVIVLPEVEVRSGNGAGYDLVFAKPIHQGVEVQILETRGNWTLLEFPNEVRGWLLSSGVEAVEP